MFRALGQTVSRFWPLLLVAWILIVAAVDSAAPQWRDVVEDGEFAYLPEDVPSREGERLFGQAFSHDMLGSSVVVVVRRESREAGLLEADDEFIDGILKPRIELIGLLWDVSTACSGGGEDREATFVEIHRLLSEVWRPAVDPWNVDSDGSARRERKRVETSIAAASAAVRDWHADLFGAERDPDAETGGATPLRERLRRQLVNAEIPPEQWSVRLRNVLQPGVGEDEDASRPKWAPPEGAEVVRPEPIILRVRTFSDSSIGNLLRSDDGKASLVVVELKTEFQTRSNQPIIRQIEKLVDIDDPQEPGILRGERLIPPGLDLALSGSATVGRDMRANAEESADNTHFWTLVLVVVLLLGIYRAPVLVLIPLATVFVSVELALDLLACLAGANYIGLFSGIEIYSTVVMYGAGIDYCMFLIARYKEELDGGATLEEATQQSIVKVGAALAASAGTTMCGIGMMVFADFGKFRQAGVAMSFGLFFVLAAALTFAPALLRLFGRWAFWPHMRSERISAAPGWLSPTSLMAQLLERKWFAGVWDRLGQTLLRRPGTVWLASIAVMLPFVVIAVLNFGNLSYGLLTDLPADETSVVGAKAVQAHFPAGQTGPITILLENQRVDFREKEGRNAVEELTRRLNDRRDELQIADIRSVTRPLGSRGVEEMAGLNAFGRAAQTKVMRRRGLEHYVSDKGNLAGHVTRIDVVCRNDPFSRESIGQFDRLRRTVVELLPAELAPDSRLLYIGATPSIRDLKTVTASDQVRIDFLVVGSVFLVLVLLLRRLAICGYLIVSVAFSYLVALGFTFTVFWAVDPVGFTGLDWKVPMFLFTILIAVGEDYNIYLITRIDEEQQRHGMIEGVTVALSKTGKIISSCGLIMAGTFASLAIGGSLAAMRQLGFALASGVLLDTFVVRPVLVPAYLILLHSGRFGFLGKFLGAGKKEFVPTGIPVTAEFGSDGPK